MTTNDEARGLAARWATEHAGESIGTPMIDGDRKRLESWVRERMAAEVETMLGVWAECGGHEITRNEAHEAISHAVKMDLELTPEQARDICEAAGWPS
jgi:hypothetical protein